MTAITTAPARTTQERLRNVLRLDAVVTALAGLFAVLGSTSEYGDVPGWLPRAVGVMLVAVAAAIWLGSRLSGRQLRLAGQVCGELAVGWVVATTAVLLLVDVPATGREILLILGIATFGFAVAELRLARVLSAALSG